MIGDEYLSDEDKALRVWWVKSGHDIASLGEGPETLAFRAGWAAGVAAVKVAKLLPATVRPVVPINPDEEW